jgi:hypothetical protein
VDPSEGVVPLRVVLVTNWVRILIAILNILALDFDGVLCNGMREYFEASRRSYRQVWPTEKPPDASLLAAFRALRPVITTGWEMPLLLRAIVQECPATAILQHWEAVRDDLLKTGWPQGTALVMALTHTLDEVRRAWIARRPVRLARAARAIRLAGGDTPSGGRA